MQGKFYQACYTRVGVNEGWKPLHYSPDIPQSLLALYEKTEAGNEVKRGIPLDENGHALWMLEILCEKGYVGISRTQYGLSDAFGRSNFFSHGYLFSNAYEVLKDPNALLGIGDANFKTSIEDSEEIPTTLVQGETYSIQKALESCRMTKENYILYVKCMYYALSTNTNNTIYVRTDGKDDTMKNLLYLLYAAVPYSLRIKITAASCTELDSTNKMLIFGRNIPEYRRYIDPWTGENNILTPAIEKRWERNPFVAYFAENCENEKENEKIYITMEKWLSRMGEVTLNNMDAIHLAYSMCYTDIESESENEVAGLLYDWLALPVLNSETFERQLVILLNEIVKRETKLNDETEQLLKERTDVALSEELKNAYLQYLSFTVINLSKEEGCSYLENLGKENSIFIKLRIILSKSEKGRRLLCEFYLRHISSLISGSDCTYGDLTEAYYDCEDLDEIEPEARLLLHRKNIEISRNEINLGHDFESVKKQYLNTEKDIRREQKLPSVLCEEYARYIKSNFNFNDIDKYQDFYSQYSYILSDGEEMAAYLRCMHLVEISDYFAVERYIKSDLSYQIDRDLLIKLYEYIIRHNAAEECTYLSFWKNLAKRMKMPFVKMLVKNHAAVLYNPELLIQSLKEDSAFWKTTEQIEDFYEVCVDYAEQNDDKLLYESCEVIKRELKQRKAEEKKRRKEKAKQEKAADKRKSKKTEEFDRVWEEVEKTQKKQSVKDRLFGWRK